MSDYYDARGRLLDGPDDDPSCRHGNNADTCAECRAEFEAEERDYLFWRASQPAPSVEIAEDLPF